METPAESFAREQIRAAIERVRFECGVPYDAPLVQRLMKALSIPTPGFGFCVFCGIRFQLVRKWQRFCSIDCRNRYHVAAAFKSRAVTIRDDSSLDSSAG